MRWLFLGIPLLLSACADDGVCRISTLGNLEVLNATGSPIVKATVNGHPVAFIVDTGAQISSIWPQEVDKLDLVSSFHTVRMRGTGGETFAGVAIADKLGMGSGTASDIPFVTVGNLFDGRMVNGLPVVGLFGADFLSSYDVVFDLPARRINLYVTHGCGESQPDWNGGFYKIGIDHGSQDRSKIQVHLKLDGHPMEAFLDSGAHRTLISLDDALAAGVKKADLLQDRRGVGIGIDDRKTVRYLHHFDSLDIGPFRIMHPVLNVGDTRDSLLGAEFLRRNRVWIPRRENWIFVQPVLAKVLSVSQPPPSSPAAPASASAGQ